MQNTLEERKILEAEFHDRLRDPALQNDPELYSRLTSNKKWYTVARQSKQFAANYLRSHSPGARALDFACGDGQYSLLMAEAGANVTGIDISGISIENAAREARKRGLRADFHVMDCERMTFADNTFDLINANGVLHHLDLVHAYPELARVLKPTGSVICVEAIAHNPVFHAYRRLTPHLRTEFEADHILRRKDVLGAKRYFNRVECKFFHLASLAAVPLRNSPLFEPTLSILEKTDSFLLNVGPLRWWAWQVAFILSGPKTINS